MKWSISYPGAKASIFHADDDDIEDVKGILELFVTPLLIAAGYPLDVIKEGYALVAEGPPPVAAVAPELPASPFPLDRGFVYLGRFGSRAGDEHRFQEVDLRFWNEDGWDSCVTFNGTYHYAAREGSPAHKHAIQHYLTNPQS